MRRVMVGMAGHIDHGKSALVRRLTGVDMDRRPEEKARGLTIDLGFAALHKAPDLWVGIVDVPGHERFIRNMVAGATGIDLVCLVVAADDGIMPQTREHLQIAQLLGVPTGVVALNKVDLVDADGRELALDDLQRFLKGSFLEGAPIVPVSTVTGEGIEALRKALLDAARKVRRKDAAGVFRLPVQRVFTVAGFGAVVTGIPFSGSVKVGDPVEILPSGKASRIRGIQAYGEKVDHAEAGHSVALNLAEVSHQDLARGDVVAAPGYFKPTRVVELRMQGLRKPTPVRLHVGTAEALGTAIPISADVVEVRLEEPVVAAAGDHAILRRQSPVETLGGGLVISASGVRRGKRRGEDLKALDEVQSADPASRVRLALERAGRAGATKEALQASCLIPPEGLERLLASEARVGSRWLSRRALDEMEGEAVARLEAFHKAQPLLPAMELPALREAMKAAPEILDAALARSKSVVVEGGGARLRAHAAKATGALESLAELYRKGGVTPPDPPPGRERDLDLLVKQGVLVKAADGVYFHREPLALAREKVVAECQAKGEMSTPRAREIFAGVTRKHLIPLLEQLDKEGLTRRAGNSRFLRTAMKRP